MIYTAVLLGLLAFASNLPAALVIYSCGASSLTISNATPTATEDTTCPQFDPGLGTLTGVGSPGGSVASVVTGSITLQNNTGADVTTGLTYGFDYTFTYTLPGFSPSLRQNPALGPGTTIPNGSSATLAIIGTPFPLMNQIPPVMAAGYMGLGTVVVPLQFSFLSAGPTFPVTGLTLESYTATASPQLLIAYLYDPVPEPGTLLLTLAPIGIAMLLRRARR